MTRRRLGLGALTAVTAITGLLALQATRATGTVETLSARVVDSAGRSLGTIRFSPEEGAVLVKGKLSGIAPGFHGFHVHSTGICDPAARDAAGNLSPFFTAGGHFNPSGVGHGAHAGDLPPLLVGADGTANVRFTTDRFTLGSLDDSDGSAVIVHAAADNLAHIPATTASGADRYHSHVDNVLGADAATRATGDAGARFGCGVVGPVNE